MCRKVILGVILLSGGGVFALLLHLSWPWRDSAVTLRAKDYWGLVSLILWALAPYLALLVRARKPLAATWKKVVMLFGSTLIAAGGFGIYLDAVLLHPAPLSLLVFLAIPFYQWAGVGLLLFILSRWFPFFKSSGSFG